METLPAAVELMINNSPVTTLPFEGALLSRSEQPLFMQLKLYHAPLISSGTISLKVRDIQYFKGVIDSATINYFVDDQHNGLILRAYPQAFYQRYSFAVRQGAPLQSLPCFYTPAAAASYSMKKNYFFKDLTAWNIAGQLNSRGEKLKAYGSTADGQTYLLAGNDFTEKGSLISPAFARKSALYDQPELENPLRHSYARGYSSITIAPPRQLPSTLGQKIHLTKHNQYLTIESYTYSFSHDNLGFLTLFTPQPEGTYAYDDRY